MASLGSIDESSLGSQVEIVRKQMVLRFSKSHQILKAKETVLLSELDQLVASYKGEGIKRQIQQLHASKEFMIATINQNESSQTLQLSIAPLDAHMKELQNELDTSEARVKSVQLEWDEELEQRLDQIGKITVNAEKKIGITSPKFAGATADANPGSIPNPPPDIPEWWGKRPFGAAKSPRVVKRNYIGIVETLFPYKAQKADELTFTEDKTIYVLKKNPDGWHEGVLDGVRGFYPANYVKAK